MTGQSRHAAGTPSGGQFAPSHHAEGDIELGNATAASSEELKVQRAAARRAATSARKRREKLEAKIREHEAKLRAQLQAARNEERQAAELAASFEADERFAKLDSARTAAAEAAKAVKEVMAAKGFTQIAPRRESWRTPNDSFTPKWPTDAAIALVDKHRTKLNERLQALRQASDAVRGLPREMWEDRYREEHHGDQTLELQAIGYTRAVEFVRTGQRLAHSPSSQRDVARAAQRYATMDYSQVDERDMYERHGDPCENCGGPRTEYNDEEYYCRCW